MPTISGSRLAKTRSRKAVATRLGTPSEIATASRDHAAEQIAAYVERVVAGAPTLTDEQRDRISLLLKGAAAA